MWEMAAVNVRKRVEICSQDLAETIYIAYIYSFREREKKKQNKKKTVANRSAQD